IRDFHVTGVQTCALPISSDKGLGIASPPTYIITTNTDKSKEELKRDARSFVNVLLNDYTNEEAKVKVTRFGKEIFSYLRNTIIFPDEDDKTESLLFLMGFPIPEDPRVKESQKKIYNFIMFLVEACLEKLNNKKEDDEYKPGITPSIYRSIIFSLRETLSEIYTEYGGAKTKTFPEIDKEII